MSSGTLLEEVCANLGVNLPENASSKIVLYPNPVSDYFKINYDVSTVYVYDITGRIVKQFKGSFEKDSEFEISSLVKGMYFVGVISNNGEALTMKIVKQ